MFDRVTPTPADRRSRATPGRSSISTIHYPLSISPAFTLIELLVVIGIIGLVVALGVPLFGVITGSRSQEAGQNLVSAAIGQARTIALNEGKYAGVLFYIDPATERTAMTVVVVQDPQSGLEDPDPYDKYKTWVGRDPSNPVVTPQEYRTASIAADGTVTYSDRVISITSDAMATFKSGPKPPLDPTKNLNVYDTVASNPSFSNLSRYFGNFKPTVKVYRAVKDSSSTDASVVGSPVGNRPPRNGPFTTTPVTASPPTSGKYTRIQGVTPADSTYRVDESQRGTFQNDYWTADAVSVIAPSSLAGGERQLLPLGVGVQLIIQPKTVAFGASTYTERYARVAIIMFDPQGKLSLDSRVMPFQGTLGTQLGITADVAEVPAAVGVVFYDRATFKLDSTRTEADSLYQPGAMTPSNPFTVPAGSIYADFSSGPNEVAEETWLDQNTVPLLINRYSGALSEAQ